MSRPRERASAAHHSGRAATRAPTRRLDDRPPQGRSRAAEASDQARAGHCPNARRVTLNPKTLSTALEQAGLSIDELRHLL